MSQTDQVCADGLGETERDALMGAADVWKERCERAYKERAILLADIETWRDRCERLVPVAQIAQKMRNRAPDLFSYKDFKTIGALHTDDTKPVCR